MNAHIKPSQAHCAEGIPSKATTVGLLYVGYGWSEVVQHVLDMVAAAATPIGATAAASGCMQLQLRQKGGPIPAYKHRWLA